MIYLGADHAGYEYKNELITWLKSKNIDFKDYGTFSNNSCDYPDIAYKVCSVMSPTEDFGILICGTGIGMSIAANKFSGIRAAVCDSVELAKLARTHNNANVLCLGSRVIKFPDMFSIVRTFLESEFEYGRHLTRINKLESNRIY